MTALFYIALNGLNQSPSLYKYGGHQGKFYLARIDNNGPVELHHNTDLFKLLKIARAQPYHNWFIASNTLRTARRSQIRKNRKGKDYINVRTLTCFYLDFDVMDSGLDLDKFRCDLPSLLNACDIDPSAVIKSGHGYHVYIMLNQGVAVNSPIISNLWNDIEDAIYNRVYSECMKRYGKPVIDHKVRDITRLLRVIGTFNMKKQPIPVTIQYENLDTDKRPSLNDLKMKWLINNPDRNDRHKKNGHHVKPFKKYHNHKRIHHATGKTIATLLAARRRDLFKSAKLKRYESRHSSNIGFIKHYREYTLFYYADSSVMALDDDITAKNLKSLNKQFPKPLPKTEVNHVINELPYIRNKIELAQYLRKHPAELKKSKQDGTYPGGYVPTNDTIALNIGLNAFEASHMETLLGVNERNKRHQSRLNKYKAIRRINRIKRQSHKQLINARRNEQKRVAKQNRINKLNQRNYQIIVMHGKGMSLRATAKRFNLSKSAVYKIVHQGVHFATQNMNLMSTGSKGNSNSNIHNIYNTGKTSSNYENYGTDVNRLIDDVFGGDKQEFLSDVYGAFYGTYIYDFDDDYIYLNHIRSGH